MQDQQHETQLQPHFEALKKSLRDMKGPAFVDDLPAAARIRIEQETGS